MGARANVHLKVLYGRSNHHKIEACFKAFGRALRVACAKDKRLAKMLPSTKGCCDCARGLRRRQPDVGAQGAGGASGRGSGRRPTPAELAAATGVIVPGVGHFSTTAALDDGWRDAIRDALARGRCRCSASASACSGCSRGRPRRRGCPGCGVMRGSLHAPRERSGSGSGSRAARRRGGSSTLKVPHVGWNSLSLPRPTRLFAGVPDGAQVYFTHSYAAPIVECHGRGDDLRRGVFGGRGGRPRRRACSSTPRSLATSGCGCCATGWRACRSRRS